MSNPTRTQLLIEERLGRPLGKYVMRLRESGEERARTSWEQIAHRLAADTGVTVTAETLRSWYKDADMRRIEKARNRPQVAA